MYMKDLKCTKKYNKIQIYTIKYYTDYKCNVIDIEVLKGTEQFRTELYSIYQYSKI